MKEIMTITAELENQARRESQFRKQVKDYLKRFGRIFDKFTITGEDDYLGCISERAIINYLIQNYGDRFEIHRWAEKYDVDLIYEIVKRNSGDTSDLDYVQHFFYDRYDLEIVEKETQKRICVDVKTAQTKKQPNDNWDFLYPVVQNSREGKDCIILCYHCTRQDKKSIVLVGYITEHEISQKRILRVGEITKFGTTNQIDNYETLLSDYRPLSHMLCRFFGYEIKNGSLSKIGG